MRLTIQRKAHSSKTFMEIVLMEEYWTERVWVELAMVPPGMSRDSRECAPAFTPILDAQSFSHLQIRGKGTTSPEEVMCASEVRTDTRIGMHVAFTSRCGRSARSRSPSHNKIVTVAMSRP